MLRLANMEISMPKIFLFQRKMLLLQVESYIYGTMNISLRYHERMFKVL